MLGFMGISRMIYLTRNTNVQVPFFRHRIWESRYRPAIK